MISRKKSFIIAGGIIFAFFAGGIFLFNQKPSIVTPLGTASIELDASTGPKLVLNDFHRSETKNGKLVWEVHAKEGSFSPSNQTAEVTSPIVRFIKKQGEVKLRSLSASLAFQGQSLTKAHLKDEVVLEQKDPPFTLKSNEAIFNQSEQTVNIPGSVEIISDSITVNGEGMTGNVDTGVFKIEKKVKSVIKGKPKVGNKQ